MVVANAVRADHLPMINAPQGRAEAKLTPGARGRGRV
jgi:hypothetical protein